MAKKPKRSTRVVYDYWREEDNLLRLEGWARDGLTNADIAHNIGVNNSTLSGWIKKYPEIREALAKGQMPADVKVENAFYKRATGQWIEEKDVFVEKTGNNLPTKKVIKKTRYIPPDTTAGIFWLKNRKPDKWQRVSEAEYRKITAEAKKYEMEVIKLEKEIEELQEMKEARVVILDSWGNDEEEKREKELEKKWDEKLSDKNS